VNIVFQDINNLFENFVPKAQLAKLEEEHKVLKEKYSYVLELNVELQIKIASMTVDKSSGLHQFKKSDYNIVNDVCISVLKFIMPKNL
jgi:hypothetical protein